MAEDTSKFLSDVTTIKIIVKSIGPHRAPAIFNRIVDRCSRQGLIQVSENPKRLFQCAFLPSVSFSGIWRVAGA
ncbi:unnamed protein product [Caenorhabditis auriculariae]|uniref:Uncharacterized protein n=1 Tax=Caenorhabditis auriculariae TaxID=2777116 RepID=A0A8S1GWZ3_9PELO|nr:unnamed protein product [Caenorhabditis auriculariae]